MQLSRPVALHLAQARMPRACSRVSFFIVRDFSAGLRRFQASPGAVGVDGDADVELLAAAGWCPVSVAPPATGKASSRTAAMAAATIQSLIPAV